MSEPIVAWHFARADRKLGYGDGRTIERGSIFHIDGNIGLCTRGLHGSVRALDALRYAPGGILSRTVHTGTVEIGDDKLVSSIREHVVVVDASAVLAEFVKWCLNGAACYAADAAARYAAAAAAADATARHAAAHYAVRYAAAADAAHYAVAAERKAQNEKLEHMLFELIQSTGEV